MGDKEEIIRVEGLVKRFGKRYAVRDLSFCVERGDLFGFLGPNGAGKSTTLYILLGLIRADAGQAAIFGRPPSDLDGARRRVGALIESAAFYPHLTAQKNLEMSARLLGEDAIKTVPAVLEQMGLADAANLKVRHYSSGMRQRLGIARALLGSPDLLILDEPTNGLDPEGKETAWRILEDFTQKQGKTALISSHLLHEVEEACNRVCVIREGEAVACGEVENLLAPDTRQLDVVCEDSDSAERLRELIGAVDWLEEQQGGRAGERRMRLSCRGRRAADLAQFLIQNNIRLEEFTPVRQSLNDFFLNLTGNKK
ncbi:MAG TPA: ABC transporter ATP-binding protein [Candidatus Sumerlaeia bacterium]|nr:ABC transporter ATP-binding protein [Candidatus Sumerlaeia bacterium]